MLLFTRWIFRHLSTKPRLRWRPHRLLVLPAHDIPDGCSMFMLLPRINGAYLNTDAATQRFHTEDHYFHFSFSYCVLALSGALEL